MGSGGSICGIDCVVDGTCRWIGNGTGRYKDWCSDHDGNVHIVLVNVVIVVDDRWSSLETSIEGDDLLLVYHLNVGYLGTNDLNSINKIVKGQTFEKVRDADGALLA